jgi:hypothetical protein
MSDYRAYFMQGERFVAREDIEAADDPAAILKAGQLLASSISPRIEVWQGKRIVGSLSDSPWPAEPTPFPPPLRTNPKAAI